MKILVTGSNGQLGNELRLVLEHQPQIEAFFTDVDTLDICNPEALEAFCAINSPDYIINCAAYTAVDRAEDDERLCFRINSEAAYNLGEIAARNNIRLVHISTDYVFDGSNFKPYVESDPVCPTNVYGRSKLDGERRLQQVCPDALIIRTSWLYSSFGNNFVKTMLRLGSERESLNVIFDQVGTPTYAADLAASIIQIIVSGRFVGGLFHFSNEGVCSWYDFTKAIFRLAHVSCAVRPIESGEYAVRTPRPHYSVLNKAKIKQTFGLDIPYWEESLQKCLRVLSDTK